MGELLSANVVSPKASSEPTGEVELTILMPCLNEAETLATCIRKARRFLADNGVDGEVLIADNGSTDGSREIAVAEGARLVPVPARGYGAALLGGIAAARGRYMIMGDADDSYDFSNLMPFLEQLRGGADLVMGNRFRGGIAPGAMPRSAPLPRQPGPVVARPAVLQDPDRRLPLRPARLPHATASASWACPRSGMEFASEMVVRRRWPATRSTEVPTTLRQGRPLTPAPPAHLARRLAAPALPAHLQPALAVPLPGHRRCSCSACSVSCCSSRASSGVGGDHARHPHLRRRVHGRADRPAEHHLRGGRAALHDAARAPAAVDASYSVLLAQPDARPAARRRPDPVRGLAARACCGRSGSGWQSTSGR